MPARKTRHGEPCNLALFSATGFLMLFAPSFRRIRHRQKNGRFSGGRLMISNHYIEVMLSWPIQRNSFMFAIVVSESTSRQRRPPPTISDTPMIASKRPLALR